MTHKHVWTIALVQGSTVLVECERCPAVVGAGIAEHGLGGHAFMFAALQGTVTDQDFMRVSDLVTRRFAPHERYRVDVNVRELRRRRKSPARPRAA